MKFVSALVCLAGIANGAAIKPVNFEGLGNGMYTIPLVRGKMDLSRATRDAYNISSAIPSHITALVFGENNTTVLAEASSTASPPSVNTTKEPDLTIQCAPQFPTRKTQCRERTIKRHDYMIAYAKYIDWIVNGPDDGWVPKHTCKAMIFGSAVVSTCTWGGANPTCTGELIEAMRELDMFCAEEDGGDIRIHHWKKTYGRHNVRDGI